MGVLVWCYQEGSTPQCFEALDVPPSTPSSVPIQGHPPIAAAALDALALGAENTPKPIAAGSVGEVGVLGAFFQGYRDAGGRYPEERIAAMIQCESSWRVNPPGSHLGLAQFSPGTWATVSGITGFADLYNPFHQGFNTATWASMVSPGTTAGWPYCWWAW